VAVLSFRPILITWVVREYANTKGIKDLKIAVETGLKEKAAEFKTVGGEIYQKT
jgi:phosphomethylpyrimidine synthase